MIGAVPKVGSLHDLADGFVDTAADHQRYVQLRLKAKGGQTEAHVYATPPRRSGRGGEILGFLGFDLSGRDELRHEMTRRCEAKDTAAAGRDWPSFLGRSEEDFLLFFSVFSVFSSFLRGGLELLRRRRRSWNSGTDAEQPSGPKD